MFGYLQYYESPSWEEKGIFIFYLDKMVFMIGILINSN